MPLYELDCKDCGNQYERLVSFSATVLPACPACGSVDINRLLGKPAIHFKGSGWYITDSKKEDEKKKAAAQKANSNGTDKPTGSEPDSEPDSEPKSESESESDNVSKSETENSSPSETRSDAKKEA